MGKYKKKGKKYITVAASLALAAGILAGCGNVKQQNAYKQKGIAAMEDEDYQHEKVAPFRERNFEYRDGHSTDRVIDWLILGDAPEDRR